MREIPSQEKRSRSTAAANGQSRPDHVKVKRHNPPRACRLVLEFLCSPGRASKASEEFLCFDAAISSCCQCREWNQALQLLEDMREDGLEPDKGIWDKLLEAMVISGELAPAIALYREAENLGLVPCAQGLDLHGKTVELAKLAARIALLDVALALGKHASKQHDDWITDPHARWRLGLTAKGHLSLVVGLGRQSKTGEAILGPAVWQMLSNELGLHSHHDPHNEGCLLVLRHELKSFAARSRPSDENCCPKLPASKASQ